MMVVVHLSLALGTPIYSYHCTGALSFRQPGIIIPLTLTVDYNLEKGDVRNTCDDGRAVKQVVRSEKSPIPGSMARGSNISQSRSQSLTGAGYSGTAV